MSEYISLLARGGNRAVQVNPPHDLDFHITSHGSNWYWTVFSIFGVATIVTFLLSFLKDRDERLFHHLITTAYLVLAITYFTLASNLGWTGIQAEFRHVQTSSQILDPGIRQIFYARWVGYFISFPIFFASFAAYVGLTWSSLLFTVACQEVTVISLLIGSLIRSTYKWGYFAFGICGFLLMASQLLLAFRQAAEENDFSTASPMTLIGTAGSLVMMLYPLAWGLSEGGNVVQPDSEAIFYGILDICFFVLIGAYFMHVSGKIDFGRRGIAGFQNKVFAGSHVIAASPHFDPKAIEKYEAEAAAPPAAASTGEEPAAQESGAATGEPPRTPDATAAV